MRPSVSGIHRGLLVVVTTLLLAACGKSAPPAPPAAPPPPEVTVETIRPQTLTLTQELAGRTSAFLAAEVRPQVGGLVKQRLFTEGSRVKAGQPLYQLDDAIPRADQASARATLLRAQATLNSARLTAARSAELLKVDAISKQDDENAVAALHQAEADVASAQATLARGSVVLSFATITSPITGRIGKSSVTQGALVTANQADALATVQQLDPVYVDVTQTSAELLELRKQLAAGKLEPARDHPVAIVLEDGTRHAHDGKLTFADVTVDPTTGSFLLRIVVPNPQSVLLPGMYVRAVVGSGVRPNALLVSQKGVARDPKGSTSVMVVEDGKVAVRPIVVSRTIADKWLVEDGLRAGDKVIIEGLQKIKPGIPVRLAEAPAAPAATVPANGGTPAARASPPAAPTGNPPAQTAPPPAKATNGPAKS
jgi:membrane fusion protein (multidrug efflux system)